MEAIDDQETAALQVAAHALGLIVVEVPIGHVDGIEPRPVIDFIAIRIDHFLVGARVDARQTKNTLHKLPIRSRIIFGPTAVAEISEAAETSVAGHADGIPEAGKSEFVFLFYAVVAIAATVTTAAIVSLLQRQQRGTGTHKHQQQQTARQQLHSGSSPRRVSKSGAFTNL